MDGGAISFSNYYIYLMSRQKHNVSCAIVVHVVLSLPDSMSTCTLFVQTVTVSFDEYSKQLSGRILNAMFPKNVC